MEGTSVKQTRYLYEGWNVVAEWTLHGSSTTMPTPQTYLWGLDLAGQRSGLIGQLQGAGGVGGMLAADVRKIDDASSLGRLYACYDGNGNILAWNGTDGGIKRSQAYDAFGNVVLNNTDPIGALASGQSEVGYGFSTKPQEGESGLLYYGYRYYDAITGRWISEDPTGENGGINLYGYIGNDAVNKTDLLGLFSLEDAGESLRRRAALAAPSASPVYMGMGGGYLFGAPAITGYSGQQLFDEWRRIESINIGFWRVLDKCPLCVNVDDGKPRIPDSTKWGDPNKRASWEEGLHPGAIWSMRSRKQSLGNQCIYGALGWLVLDANTHGTADLRKHGTEVHFSHDVEPVILAGMLDRGLSGHEITTSGFLIRGDPFVPFVDVYRVQDIPGPNVRKYIEVRMPW